MNKETKTQVLTISKRFLSPHPKAGENTNFKPLIQNAILHHVDGVPAARFKEKPHTIRDNRSYWESAFERNMLLSVRQWSEKPYQSPQEIIIALKPGKWGIQEITMINGHNGLEAFVGDKSIDIEVLAENDGLSRADFEAWFAPHFKRKNVFYGVIIHFTSFRY